jgi:hypothetical protein
MKNFLAAVRLAAVASLSFPPVGVVIHVKNLAGFADYQKDYPHPERFAGLTTP